MTPQLLSGARIVININNRPYAFGNVMSYDIDSSVSEVRGIDSILPYEINPDQLRVMLTLQIFRTTDNDPSLKENNMATSPVSGSSFDEDQKRFLTQSYITAEIRDKQSDKTVLFFPRCMISSRRGSVNAEDLMTETWTVISIGYRTFQST